MAERLSDEKFESIAVKQGYLTAEDLQKCKGIKSKPGKQTAKPLSEIAVSEELISQEDLDVICQIAAEGKLTFGGYEVKSVLGEGGLGTVYLAKQISMQRNVALKVLHPRWVKDEEFRKRFLLEARVVGKLSHPNLIGVFDIGFDKGRYFFSMEYVAGQTVDKIISNRGAIPLTEAIDIALQTLGALNYVWDKNLVHRDIKPSNIIVTPQKVARLGDFGFVKCKAEEKLASEDFVLGTPDYMSPEQAIGKDDLDYRSDIYSLGATFYHMITATAPYNGSESMVIRQHIKASIPSPKAIVSELPESACTIIEKMMAKSPADRYQKYDELKRDLELVKKGEAPRTMRIESGKSTIARIEDFVGHPSMRFYELEHQLTRMKNREVVYQIVIAVLASLLLLMFILRS